MGARAVRSCALVGSVCAVLAAAPASAKTPIDYYMWGGPANEQTIIKAFEAEHPDIEVNLTAVGNINDYIDKLLARVTAGSPPDVFGLNIQNTARFMALGAALPLDALVARDHVDLDAFLPGSFTYAHYDGHLYGFPRATRGAPFGAQAVAYNRDLYDAAGLSYPENGWTFADFVADGKKLTVKSAAGDVTQWGTEMAIPTSGGSGCGARAASCSVTTDAA